MQNNKKSKHEIVLQTLISIKDSSIKSQYIDRVFQIICNNGRFIPDELVLIIKTYVFYDFNKTESKTKYYNKIYKSIECKNEETNHFCLDYY
jgi:hypothetical protein